MGFLAGKRILLTGLLSNRSIAYGIAQACKREGAELAFTYVGDRFKDRITEFATEFGSDLVFPCDVADDAQIEALFASLKERWDSLDGLVHSIGFAPREAIAGDFLDGMTRENFRIAHDISAYSFPALAKAALPMLSPDAALLTLSYLGAERAIPNYNTMGLAKASLEASVRYLAVSLGAKGVRVNILVPGFFPAEQNRKVLSPDRVKTILAKTPMNRFGEAHELIGATLLLASDAGSFVTGTELVVDGGFDAMTI